MVRISNLDLIKALKENSRVPFTELARRFGVTETAIRKRIRRLEDEGVIRRYTIDVDPKKIGLDISALVGVDTEPQSYISTIDRLKKMDEVCCLRSSSGDHMILIDCMFRDSGELSEFVKRLEKMEGVTKVCPAVITDRIK
jgi:Lrp/AsnC family transcriptional regulator for asnA, asnC and gidA